MIPNSGTQNEAFNARNLRPEQVAETFIVNPAYHDLVGNDHVLLMGPRGSGKTTLFKMLTLPALYSWDNQFAKDLLMHPRFVAVYIPSDIQWHQQLKYSEESLDFQDRFGESVSIAAVTTSILLALCTTFRDRLKYEFPSLDSTEKQAALCSRLISAWHLPPTIPYLPAIEEALESRMSQVRLIASRAYATHGKSLVGEDLPKFFYLDYFTAVKEAITVFDHLFCDQRPLRWALCFDELELAPQWLQKRLMMETRSTDQRFVFKLSTSPLPDFWNQTPATFLNDFHRIPMWEYGMEEKKRTFDFCDNLTRSVLLRKGITATPRELFGTSLTADYCDGRDKPEEYGRGSDIWKLIRDAADRDPSLRSILTKKGISATDPATASVEKRDQVLRKIKPILLFRNAFSKVDEKGNIQIRSRKVADIYSGVEAIYKISDGNPRWLIWIVNELLGHLSDAKDGTSTIISPSKQARVLTRASQQFSALVGALPEATEEYYGSRISLQAILRMIGEYFSRSMLLGAFSLDPIGTFVVDERTPDSIRRLLSVAVHQGAVILVDGPDSTDFSLELTGKRCRLSYTLSPTYRLPLRKYAAIQLSECLGKVMPRRSIADPLQIELLLEDTT